MEFKNLSWREVATLLPDSRGKVFTRKSWKYNEQCIYFVPSITCPTGTESAKILFGSEVVIAGYISYVDKKINPNSTIVGWHASAADASANDWIEVEVDRFGKLELLHLKPKK
jgi:hypothetical protein